MAGRPFADPRALVRRDVRCEQRAEWRRDAAPARIRLAATRGVTGSTVAGTRDVLAASDQLRRSRGRLGLDRRDRVFVAEVEHRDDDNGNEQHAEHRERDDDAFHFDATGLDTWTTTPHEIGSACGNELAGLLCAGTGCAASQRAAAPMSCGPMR